MPTPINIRLIILHAIAAWFFIHSFQTLSFLYYGAEIADKMRTSGETEFVSYVYEFAGSEKLAAMVLITQFAAIAGLVVASLISFFIAKRNYWHWANTIIIMVVLFILTRFGWDGWSLVKDFFLTPGTIFTSVVAEYFANGILLLIPGLLLFFLPPIIRFIENGQRA